MIRGICGHVWEQPGHSCIILQLNLDRHEEIFSLPTTTSSTQKQQHLHYSPKSRRLKTVPDKNTPIVVRVSVSAPSLDEMPQSIQLWQCRGIDEESLATRFSILPRIEVFNNSFCVVTVLYRDYNYLLVGMSGNLKRATPTSPCKHNVIVSVEPAISNGKGGEPELHPLTNLHGPSPRSPSSPSVTGEPKRSSSVTKYDNGNENDHHQQQSPSRPLDPRQQYKNMESAFVSPPRQLEHVIGGGGGSGKVEIVKNKGTNFYHITRNPTTSSTSSPSLSTAMKRTSNGVYVPMPSATSLLPGVASHNDDDDSNKNKNSKQMSRDDDSNNNNKSKEDTGALHLRRTDKAFSVNRQFGFISPPIPEELKFKQPVNGNLIPTPHYQKMNSRYHNNASSMLPVPLPPSSKNHHHSPGSAGPRSASGIQLVREEETQTQTQTSSSPADYGSGSLKIEKLIGQEEDDQNRSSPPPPPPPPLPPTTTTTEDMFSTFLTRFHEWNETLEEIALMYLAKQARLYQIVVST